MINSYISGVIMCVVVLVGLVISLWGLLGNRKNIVNKLFFCVVLLFDLNILFSYLQKTSSDPSVAMFWAKLVWITISLLIPVAYFFSLYFPGKVKSSRTLSVIMVSLGVIFSFTSLFTDLLIKGMTYTSGESQVIGGVGMNYFYIILVISICVSLGIIFRKFFQSPKEDKLKIKYFTSGLIVAIVISIISSIILPTLFNVNQFYYLGDYSYIIFFGLTGYGIVKHRLFDVKFAVVRSVTYSMVLVTLAGVYLIVASLFSIIFNSNLTSPGQTASGIALSLLLAFLFQPIRRFFDKITNKVFYKDNYNSEDFFARLNRTLIFTTDLRNLLERAAHEIGSTLKSEQTFFFISTAEGHHITAGTPGHRQFPKDDAIQLQMDHSSNYGVIVASLREDSDQIRRIMVSHRIELILPLTQDDETIGYLCLGEHLTSGYTNRDMKVLSTISDGLIIAIKNALAVQEIRELNSTLQQRINNAVKELRTSNMILRRLDRAKDEFVNMASHQLRTPLTSVKGYISMVLEGDVGEISDSQRQLLGEAFVSSERMTRLISDFLNVSRIQTGKFVIEKHPIDLPKLVEQEIDSLQSSASVRNLKFDYNSPDDFPTVEIDESKIRQVVMNFIDNAVYYSRDGATIVINLVIEGDNVAFTVKDSGIGVPRSEQVQLFTKFYRASNARKQRPDGTGVGLYLAKMIINAHGGKMIFESTQDVGSTFGFYLPIK